MVVSNQLEHDCKQSEETSRGYSEEEDVSRLLFQSLTAHYNNIDDQVERDAEDDENHVVD